MNLHNIPFMNSLDPPNSGYPEDEVDAHAVVAQLGGEVALALSAALERLATLAANDHHDRDLLRVLREDIDQARRAGIRGQQLVRLGSGEVRLTHERVDLSALLRDACALRQREFRSRGIDVRATALDEVAMVTDGALVFSLIETLFDWASEHTRSRVVFKLEAKQNPTRARLTVGLLRRRSEGVPTLDVGAAHDPALSTLSWRLLKQTAHVLGLKLRRRDGFDRCEMRLSFPGADGSGVSTLRGMDADDISPQTLEAQPLSGRHVVVLSSSREIRATVRDALRASGSMVDFVATVEEARRLFEDALPHAVVYEAVLGGDHFERLRADLLAEVPSLAFIAISEGGRAFEVLEAHGHPYASIGVEGLAESLPPALLFELSRHG
jgi:hypothetical protein